MTKPPTLTFLGAAGEVTGSSTLLETDRARVLVDFGLFQGNPTQEARNADVPPIDFRSLDAVICTHAHIDHCGRLGMLPKLGFRNSVFCHEATAELLPRVLASSANLQQVRLEEYRKGTAPDAVVLDPVPDPAWAEAQRRTADPVVLYARGDAERVARSIVGVPYRAWRDLAPGIRMRLHDAGHIVGSASVELEITHGASRTRVLFSGDVGPAGPSYLATREGAPAADVVIMESTTGARPVGAGTPDVDAMLREVIADARANGRMALFPTFSVGRAQVLVHHLAKLSREGVLGGMPVYLDSPMAIRAGEVCCAHPELLSAEAQAMIAAGDSPLDFDELWFVWSRKQSLKLLDREGPAIVLAGSGFCDAGPILHHLERHLAHERGHVVFTGYVLPGSLAEGLATGTARRVRINGTELNVRARVSRMHGLSGHAHMDDLAQWLVSDGHSPELVLLNHGDDAARQGAGTRISDLVQSDIGLPGLLDPIEIA